MLPVQPKIFGLDSRLRENDGGIFFPRNRLNPRTGPGKPPSPSYFRIIGLAGILPIEELAAYAKAGTRLSGQRPTALPMADISCTNRSNRSGVSDWGPSDQALAGFG